MEYVYAAMLLHKAGHKVTDAGVKKILEAAGISADESRIKALVAALEGVNIDEAIKTASFAAAPVAAAPAAAHHEAKKEKKEEEETPSADEAAAGLGALFG